MNKSVDFTWHLIGYTAPAPDDHAFVNPIVRTGTGPAERTYCVRNGIWYEFLVADSKSSLTSITPVPLGSLQLEDAASLLGFQHAPGRVCFGDAYQLSKPLMDLAFQSDQLSSRVRQEISDLIARVISRSDPSSGRAAHLEGVAQAIPDLDSSRPAGLKDSLRVTVVASDPSQAM